MKKIFAVLIVLTWLSPVLAADTALNGFTNITESSLTANDEFVVWNGAAVKNITVENLWDWYVANLGSENFASGLSAGSVTWSWNTGSGTDASLVIADDSFTANKKVVATAFETSAADGTHHVNIDNTAENTTSATGDIWSYGGAVYFDSGASNKTFAFLESPSFTTPVLGDATATSIASSGNVTGLMPSVVLTHASGVHDGSNDAAIMTDSGESFATNAMVGMTLYNVTDASSCTVTANAATTITCTLAGGTDNNWDTNDVWQVGPGPNQSGSAFYVSLASTIRHPATAGYQAAYYVDGAVTLTIEVADATTIVGATAATVDAGDTIDSPATAGSFIVLHNKSATSANTWGKNGTWTDGGAS